MFALRGLATSLSVFVTVYCALSLIVSLTWRKAYFRFRHQQVRYLADAVFVLRMLPLAAAFFVTIVLAVPSFLWLEPRTIEEPIGGLSLPLGLAGLVVLALGAANALQSLFKASQNLSVWTTGAELIDTVAPFPVLRTAGAAPPMTAIGIIRPRILFSRAAEFLLNANEFQSALNHEIAHLRRRDNLKKLLLRFVLFPGMREVEVAWLEATEMAADDAAVSNIGEALDLAAALIKLCRLGTTGSSAELIMSLVHSPLSLVNERVERLIHWSGPRPCAQRNFQPYALGLGLALLTTGGFTYTQLLMGVHVATEWLVR
jgi:Zn-dependent protease with chaperone function